MASTIRFFEQPSVESRYEKKSDKYFPTEPVKPVVKKIDKEEESARLLLVSLGAPILEELIFRGAILQLLLLLIGLAFPPMLLFPCLNLGISVAAAAAIFITAGLFGVAHAGNGKNNHAQVVATFVMGLAFGFFAVQFGLLVAIGAHILNNTIASALGNLLSSPTTKKEEKVVESLENNFSELKMA